MPPEPNVPHQSRPNPLGLQPFDPSEPYVFVSYSRVDTVFVQRFARDLQNYGVNVWIDQIGLTAGTPNWDKALRDAVRNSIAFLLIASPTSRESNYVADEITLARMYAKPIYPIWALGDQFMDSIPMGMGRTQYIDARQDAVYPIAISLTVEAVKGVKPELQLPEPTLQKKPTLKPHQLANPYKGLESFRSQDRELFFGRTQLIADMVKAIAEFPRFMGVLGASGSGKSSVVMAGLLPTLADGALPGSRAWVYLAPFTPSGSPLERMAEVFARELPQKTLSVVRDELDHPTAQGVTRLARQVVDLNPERRVVVYIDQFEELFTLTRSQDEREQFIHLLTTAVDTPDSPVTIILSLRADFYDHALEHPALAALLAEHQKPVTRMSLAELYEAVRAPAAAVGIDFEDGLVSDLVFAVRDEPGTLPLLQFTLAKLYEQRTGGKLTRAAYQAIGEVLGALAQHAETTYAALPSDDHRKSARDLFLKLITPGNSEQETARRRAKASELDLVDPVQRKIIHAVKEAFVNARLLTTDRIRDDETLEVSHEALIRRWDRLAVWLHDARDDVLFGTGLNADVDEWMRRSKPTDQPERIYQFSKLREAQDWVTRNPPDQGIADFLQASVVYQQAQERLDEQRKRELREAAELAAREQARAEQATQMATTEQARAESATQRARRQNRISAAVGAFALVFVIGAILISATQIGRSTTARNDANTAAAEAATAIVDSDKRADTAVAVVNAASTDVGVARHQMATADAQAATAINARDRAQQEAVEAERQIIAAQASARAVATQVAQLGSQLESEVELASRSLALAAEAALNDRSVESAGLLSVLALDRFYNTRADNTLIRALDRIQDPVRVLEGHTAPVRALAFSPDMRRLVSGGEGLTALVWELNGDDTPTELVIDSYVNAADYRPDNRAYVLAAGDGMVTQYDASDNTVLCSVSHPASANAVVYSPNGTYFATGDDYGGVYLWAAADCQLLREYRAHATWVSALAFTPDSRQLVSASADTVAVLWDVETSQMIRTFTGHTDVIRTVAVSPDGLTVLTGSYDQTLRLWDIATGELVRLFTGNTSLIYSAAFNVTGTQIASTADDRAVRVYDVATGEQRSNLEIPSSSRIVRFTPDGRSLALAHIAQSATSERYQISLWDVERTTADRIYSAFAYTAKNIGFSDDPNFAIIGGDNTVILWDLKNNALVRVLATNPIPFNDAAFSPDGTVVVTGSDDNIVRVWDGAPDSPRLLREHRDDVITVALSPDSLTIASAGDDFAVHVWDRITGATRHVLRYHQGDVFDLAFSADGRLLASGDEFGTVVIWEVDSGTVLRQFNVNTTAIRRMEFTPDGQILIVGDSGGYLSVLDIAAETGRGIWYSGDEITSLVLSTEGEQVLIGFFNQPSILIRMSDLLAGITPDGLGTFALQRQFQGHSTAVRAVALSNGGRYALTLSQDGLARLWDTRFQDFISYACERLNRDFTSSERDLYGIGDDVQACSGTPATEPLLNPTPMAIVALMSPTPLPTMTAYSLLTPPNLELIPSATITSIPVTTRAQIGSQAGEVPPSSGQLWTFAGQAGQRIRILVAADRPSNDASDLSATLDTRVIVTRGNGALLAESDDIARALITNSMIADLVLPATDDYFIEVRAWDESRGGRYTLTITDLIGSPTPSPSVVRTAAPTHTLIVSPTPSLTPTASPTPTITLTPSMTLTPSPSPTFAAQGQAAVGANNGNINTDGKQVWTYNGQAGEILTISVYATWDTTLSLLDSTDTELDFDDDALPNLNSQIIYQLPSSGLYTIVVGSYDASVAAGTYSLRIDSSLATPDPDWTPTPTLTATLPPAPTATPFTAEMGIITPGDQRALFNAGSIHRFQYEGQAGEALDIRVVGDWDTVLSLLDANGTEIAFNDDGLPNSNSQILITLPRAETYTLVLRGYSMSSGGLYTLTLDSLISTPTLTPSATPSPTALS